MSELIKNWRKYILPFALFVFVFAFIMNYASTMALVQGVLGWVWYIISRFVIGFAMAYMVNFLVEFFRRRLKFPRWLAIATSYVLLLGLLVWMIVYIVPLSIDSINQIITVLTDAYNRLSAYLTESAGLMDPQIYETLVGMLGGVKEGLLSFFTGLLNYPFLENVLKSSTRALINISFGFLISIYALFDKERLLKNAKLVIRAIIPKRAPRFFELAGEANSTFSRFMVGKTLDSLIIALLSYILYALFRLPIAPFLAVVAGVTNMIPYFGPIVGGVITVLLLFCYDPLFALYGLLIVVFLQTIDGMVLGPKILGDAVGISPLLTIVAISIGGDIAGFTGMFIGVPLLAVFKKTVYPAFLERRLGKEEPVPAESPPEAPDDSG